MELGAVSKLELVLPDETATQRLGARLAKALPRGAVVFLHGELGAGKTTLVRGLLHALGYAGAVKSPTYTLVEPYDFAGRRVFHFDLYRLAEPEELEAIGVRDYFGSDDLCLIEWPERGTGILPRADLSLHLELYGYGRRACLVADSDKGRRALESLNVM